MKRPGSTFQDSLNQSASHHPTHSLARWCLSVQPRPQGFCKFLWKQGNPSISSWIQNFCEAYNIINHKHINNLENCDVLYKCTFVEAPKESTAYARVLWLGGVDLRLIAEGPPRNPDAPVHNSDFTALTALSNANGSFRRSHKGSHVGIGV